MSSSRSHRNTARRRKARQEAQVRRALGLTKAQYDALRPKTRRTAADDMKDRLDRTTVFSYLGSLGLARAVLTAFHYRISLMIDRAALTERDRGALELMGLVLDEAEAPGTIDQRLANLIEEARRRAGP